MFADRGAPDSAARPLGYARPFFTSVPPAERGENFSQFGERMTDSVGREMGPIARPRTATSVLDLRDVIGADEIQEIQAAGEIKFHAVGDTGHP